MIDLQVRDESERILAHERGLEWTQELIGLDKSAFPLLAGLCAYLDTVFNQRHSSGRLRLRSVPAANHSDRSLADAFGAGRTSPAAT